MNQQEFQSGKKFTYTGHFGGLKERPLSYNAIQRLLQIDQGENFGSVTLVTDDGFIVFMGNSFGKITVFYMECELIKEGK